MQTFAARPLVSATSRGSQHQNQTRVENSKAASILANYAHRRVGHGAVQKDCSEVSAVRGRTTAIASLIIDRHKLTAPSIASSDESVTVWPRSSTSKIEASRHWIQVCQQIRSPAAAESA